MIRILTQSDFKTMPWKNGFGVTTEIHRIDHEGSMEFRVSSAAIPSSGPFSDFTGYDRTLVNLGPDSIYLTIGDEPESVLENHAVVHFDGGVQSSCRVSAPVRDLNVFCARGKYFASTIVRRLLKPEFVPIVPFSNILLYVIRGSLVAQTGDGREFLAHAEQAVFCEPLNPNSLDRWMLTSASEERCIYAAIVFRKIGTR